MLVHNWRLNIQSDRIPPIPQSDWTGAYLVQGTLIRRGSHTKLILAKVNYTLPSV